MINRWMLLMAAAVASVSAFADTPIDFSGQWIATNKDTSSNESSDGSKSADSSSGNHSGMGGGGHGGGMGGHGGMGGGHHGAGRQNSDSSNANTTANLSNDPRMHADALTIRQSETVFDIAASGQRVAYRFDNRNNYGAPYGGTVTLTWASPEMVIEMHPDGGGMIEEHYRLSDDEKTLSLVIRTQHAGSDDVREVHRQFTRDNATAASAQTLP